tara:strand:+ start:143 stop:634 length:492 start_codon:yes stop_codon:yes gene_type:complete
MSNYQIQDEALDSFDFLNIKTFISSQNFPWFYSPFVADKEEVSNDFYFTHIAYENHKLNSSQDTWNVLTPLLKHIRPRAIIRIKINAYPNIGKHITHGEHTDYPFEHKGALFSLNNCNGHTIIGDNKIDSKENRLLLFDSSKPHSSTSCTDAKMRWNININYL